MRLRAFPSVLLALAGTGVLVLPSPSFGADQVSPKLVGGLGVLDEPSRMDVTVDVFVRDKDSRPVTDVTPDQFRVYQDGTEMTISKLFAFTEQVLESRQPRADAPEGTPPADQAQPAAVSEPHLIFIVLYVDNANLRHFERNRILSHLQSFASDVLVGPVRIMVVGRLKSVEILQPFTDNPKEVTRALAGLRAAETARDERDEDHARVQREIGRAARTNSGSRAGRNQTMSTLLDSIREYADEEERQLAETLDAIRDTMTILTGVDGRKDLVYVSSGLPMVAARELFLELTNLDDRQDSTIPLTMPYDNRRHYDALAALANAQEITFHAVDASGEDRPESVFGDAATAQSAAAQTVAAENRKSALRLLADKTGGLALVKTADFDAGFKRVKSDLLTYFSIGYSVESSGEDKVHLVDVTLPQHPEYELRFRRVFVERSLHSRVQDRVTAGMFFDVHENPLGLEVSAGAPTQVSANQWMQPLTLSFPVSSLALQAVGDDLVGQAMVFVAARDLDGRRTDVTQKQHELRVPANEYDQRKSGRFTLDVRLLLEAGHHHVSVGLLDETTRQASYQKVLTATPEGNREPVDHR